MIVSLLIVLVFISFGVGMLFDFPKKGPADYADDLRDLFEEYEGLLGRANGEFAGIVIEDGETYEDDRLGVERERIRYVGLDGKEMVEPKDGFNQKRGEMEKMVKISPNSSGIYLTEVLNRKTGDTKRIETGKKIARLKEEADNMQAVKREVDDIKSEYENMKKKVRNLEDENASLRESRQSLEDEIKEYTETMIQMRKAAKKSKARAEGKEAENHMLKTELSNLTEVDSDIQDDLKGILEKTKKRFEEGREMGAVPELPGSVQEKRETGEMEVIEGKEESPEAEEASQEAEQ